MPTGQPVVCWLCNQKIRDTARMSGAIIAQAVTGTMGSLTYSFGRVGRAMMWMADTYGRDYPSPPLLPVRLRRF